MDSVMPPSPDQTIPNQRIQDQTVRHLMDYLAIADPQAAQRMLSHLNGSDPSAVIHCLARVVDEVIEALAVEVSFGRNLADGMGRMLADGAPADLDRYRRLVKDAAARGPTLASLFARHLVPVLICGDARLADRFEETTRIIHKLEAIFPYTSSVFTRIGFS